MRPKIFVAIASYRDPECQHTVRDLFLKAKHPERIFVGICGQWLPEEDADCHQVKPPFPDQVREKNYHARDAKGACWARVEALSLRQGEEYVLQIDAHMRFVKDWDELMIETLARCPSEKAGLTAMVPSYTPPETLMECVNAVPMMYVGMIGYPERLQPIHLCGWLRGKSHIKEKGPYVTPFYVGNFLFARAPLFDDVPYDPHIFFWGEEPVYSARLWTHGYDLYQPEILLLYHYWVSQGRAKIATAYKEKNDRAMTSRGRVWHVLDLEHTYDADALIEIDKYGMGNVRSLEEYWRFAGIDMKNKVITKKAAEGLWTPYQPKSAAS